MHEQSMERVIAAAEAPCVVGVGLRGLLRWAFPFVFLAGCAGDSGHDSAAPSAAPSAAVVRPPSPVVTNAPPAVPAIPLVDDARTVSAVFPLLTEGALSHAFLLPSMPDPETLLVAGSWTVRISDLEAMLARAPDDVREIWRHAPFLLLEHMVTERLLIAAARQETGLDSSVEDHRVYGALMEQLGEGIEIPNAEILRFFEARKDMLGERSVTEVAPAIRRHLAQEKQQDRMAEFVRNLGRQQIIAVSEPWIRAQAAAAADNVVDHARGSGRPTLVVFGAESCPQCLEMKPWLEALQAQYGERINVVYGDIGKKPMLGTRYAVDGIPLVLLLDAAGREVFRHLGALSRTDMERRITGQLSAP